MDRLFIFYSCLDADRHCPIAAIAVVDTGSDKEDEKSACHRFRGLFGWHPHTYFNFPEFEDVRGFIACAVPRDGYVPLGFTASRLILYVYRDGTSSLIAAVEVVDTGDDEADHAAARARFAELYGWDPHCVEDHSPYTLRPYLPGQLIARHVFHPL